MNTPVRSILSTSSALGLASFTLTSAFVAGAAASTTIFGFGLLVGYGVLQIAFLWYQTPRYLAVREAARFEAAIAPAARTTRRETTTVRLPALIEYPVANRAACTRAA